MSNTARRLLAIVVCASLGLIAVLEALRRIGSSAAHLTPVLLLLVGGFLLLSAVGLAKPYIAPLDRAGRGTGRGRRGGRGGGGRR
jgi:hypothetical protein